MIYTLFLFLSKVTFTFSPDNFLFYIFLIIYICTPLTPWLSEGQFIGHLMPWIVSNFSFFKCSLGLDKIILDIFCQFFRQVYKSYLKLTALIYSFNKYTLCIHCRSGTRDKTEYKIDKPPKLMKRKLWCRR